MLGKDETLGGPELTGEATSSSVEPTVAVSLIGAQIATYEQQLQQTHAQLEALDREYAERKNQGVSLSLQLQGAIQALKALTQAE